MNDFLKVVLGTGIAFVLIVTMARISGFLLLPVGLLTAIGMAYVVSQLLNGGATYPQWAAGIFQRTETESIRLSGMHSCDSCTDDTGRGERQTTYSELVFLGVALGTLSTDERVLCTVCANPLDAAEAMDSIDRELLRESE
jgi:hypothetical protein